MLGPWDPLPATWDSLPVTLGSLPATWDSLPVTWNSLLATWDSLPATWDSLPATWDSILGIAITRSKIVQMSSSFAYMAIFEKQYLWPFGNGQNLNCCHFWPFLAI